MIFRFPAHAAIALVAVLAIVVPLKAGDKTPKLPKGITLEEQPKDAKLAKIVFIAGSNFYKPGEHEYIGGCAVLMDLVKQTPGVFPGAGARLAEEPRHVQERQGGRLLPRRRRQASRPQGQNA